MTPLPEHFWLDDLEVDLGQQSVRRSGVDIPLSKRSFDLLIALGQAAPRIVSIDDLMSAVWPGIVVNAETVTQRIKLLRDALGDDSNAPRYIASFRARGYRLMPPVTATPARDTSPSTAATDAVVGTAPLTDTPTELRGLPKDVKERLSIAITSKSRLWLLGTAGILVAVGVALVWRHHQVQVHAAAGGGTVTVEALPSRTVAVLPFDDLSLQHDNAPLARAVPEMILQRLGTVKDLVVVARASSFSYAGQQLDVNAIGRQLGAHFLVEGTIQRIDNNLRVTAQLIDAQTSHQLASLRFDRSVADIFQMQDDLAAQLADSLHVQLLGADMHRVDRSRDTSLEVYLSYLEAQDLLNRWTVKDSARAIADLEHALTRDPGFALGYAELARAKELNRLLRTPAGPIDNDELMPLVNKALELDPRLGEAYIMRASLQSDWTAAEADYRHGLELAPNYGPGYQKYAEDLAEHHRYTESMASIDEAIAIDPIAPRNLYFKARVFEFQEKYDEAERWFQKAISTGPEYPPAVVRMAELKWGTVGAAEGIKLIERALRAEPDAPWIRMFACGMYLDLEDRAAAGEVAARLLDSYEARTLLAVYDRDYKGAVLAMPSQNTFLEFTDYAHWTAVVRQAVQSHQIDQTIAKLQSELSPKATGASVEVASDDFDWPAAYQLVFLLNLKGERAAAGPTLQELNRYAEGPKGWATLVATTRLLQGDRKSAINIFAEEYRKNHFPSWWIRERDPVIDEIRGDPRYREGLQVELDRVAKQRMLLEAMREKGEVPRRGSKSAPPSQQ